jgi:type VI secretion system protein ImpI/type VI secretion system protein
MTLTLNMLRCPDTVPPQTRTVPGGEFSIGRGAENDWVLPDPERVLSKRHCLLGYRSGGWQVADVSTNGTFLNGEAEPIGRGQSRDLRDGDRLRLGAYEIELRIAEVAIPQRASASRSNPFALDPFASPAAPSSGPLDQDPLLRGGPDHDPFARGLVPASINLPPDYDPLAPEPAEAAFTGPTQPDHSPHLDDAFRPAVARSLLPDDWDYEPAPQSRPAISPAPVGAEPAAEAPATEPPSSPPRAAPPAAPALPGQAAPTAPADDLLAAFLRGTGLSEVRPAEPAAAMEALGAAFRALVSGLRLALIARSAIKGEFRIEQTLIRSRGNNPLKFSADDDDALLALLGAGRPVEMSAAEAIADALRDMRLHEIATVAAMRSAVRALFARFDPVKLNFAAEQSGMNLLPMQKKARAWEGFEALYAQTSQALVDDFDSVFGKAFASAYERALGEASAREKQA